MSGRALKIALGVSLVANVFIIGAVAGALCFQPQKPPPRPNLSLAKACAELASAPANGFRGMLCAQLPALRPIQQDSREAKRMAMALLAAPAYDRAAVAAQLDRARADDVKARAQIENAILDFAANLPADRRERLAAALRGAAQRRALMREGVAAN